MKRQILLATYLMFLSFSTFAQAGAAEKEVADMMGSLRNAIKSNDVAALDAAFAPEYFWSTPYGTVETREQALEYFRKQKANPSYKIVADELKDPLIRIVGDIAVVTGNFRFVSEFKSAHPNDPPHIDEGRYTGILQKRGGRWHVLMEHDSEKPHDKASMEKQVAALGRAYTDMIRRNDAASIASILAEDYIVTDEEGNRLTKEQDLATYKERASTVKVETVEYKDRV